MIARLTERSGGTAAGNASGELLRVGVSVGGYAFCGILLVLGFSSGLWPFPGGDVAAYFQHAGDAVREGARVYGITGPDFAGFRYGPPWAIFFAALSWAGPSMVHGVILALDVVALWAIARGSWRRLGYVLWFPLVPFELAAGQLNLLIVAAIVVAQRGVTWPLAAVSFAKVWPILALRPRDWRPFLVASGLIALVTLPWLSLWPAWIAALVDTADVPFGPLIPIPFVLRAVVAIGLVALQRPWSRALGTAIVSPNLYWGQLVVLIAPLAVWLDPPRERPAAR